MAQSGRDISQRITLVGGVEVERTFVRIGQAAEKATADIAKGTASAAPGLKTISDAGEAATQAFGELQGSLGAAAGPINQLSAAFSGLAKGILSIPAAAVVATAGLVSLTTFGAKVASDLKEASTRVGTSVENFSKLAFVFEQSGAGADDFERAMGVIREAASSLGTSADETETARQKLDDALKGIAKSSQDAEKALDEALTKFKRSQQDRVDDLADKQAKEFQQAFDSGADLVALQEKHDKEIQDERERAAKELARQQRDAQEQRAKDQAKAFEAEQAAFVAHNKELEDLAAKSAQVQVGNFGAGDAAANLKALGVALQDSNGKARDAHDIYLDTADAIARIDDEATRAQIAVALFGRRVGPKLVESLSEGREGILRLEAEAEALGLRFNQVDGEIGKKFIDTLSKLGGTLTATSSKIGLAFAPLFGSVGEALAKSLGDAQAPLVAAAQGIADGLKPIFDDLAAAIEGRAGDIKTLFVSELVLAVTAFGTAVSFVGGAISSVFSVVGESLRQIAGLFNDVFGTNLSGFDIATFIGQVYLTAKAIDILKGVILGLNVALRLNPIIAIGSAIVVVVGLIAQYWPQIQEAFESLKKWAVDTYDAIVEKWNSTAFGQAVNAIVTAIGTVISWLASLIEWAVKAATALAAIGAGGGGLPEGAAEMPMQAAAAGGLIRGRGTGTSDSIPLWASNGEFFTNAASTAAALPLLRLINTGPAMARQIMAIFQSARGFSLGGLVGGLADDLHDAITPRRFAMGGLALAGPGPSSGRPVTIVLPGGGSFALRGDQDVVESLSRAARHQAMTSGGRKPTSYRG